MNYVKALVSSLMLAGGASSLSGAVLTGGDASDQASADSILDIVFAIDTSGSMFDDINVIGQTASQVIADLSCPGIDIWVRARFTGITGTRGTLFNESVYSVLGANSRTRTATHSEDNGPVVSDIVNNSDLYFVDDSTASQDYFKAIVTIGDEGTQNGAPVTQADWDAAYQANQDAINSDTLLFSWITDDPYSGVPDLFKTMAEGGAGGGYSFGDTNGAFVQQGSNTAGVRSTLEEIICKAGSGGTNPPPNPPSGVPDSSTTLALFGLGILGLIGFRQRFHS